MLRLTSPAEPGWVTPPRAGAAHAGVHRGAGTAAGPLRAGPARSARRRRLRAPAHRHPHRRPRGARRPVHLGPTATRWPTTACGRRHHPRVPERRRHREPHHGGGPGQGHDDARQRGPRARDRGPVPLPDRHGRPDRGCRARRPSSSTAPRRRAPRGRPTASCPTAWRRPPTSPRSGWPAASIVVREARADHMEVLLRKLRTMGLSVTEAADGDGLRAQGRPGRPACARPMSPRCRTRVWRPTTSR